MANVENFLNKITPMVIADYKSSGVLPSLTIAQEILESAWGTSELAVNANNLFGIKASNWSGRVYNKLTSEYRSDGTLYTVVAAFRAYDDWAGGIADHSEFLHKDRYAKVLATKDYKTACQEIYKAGYATDPPYPSKLISLIETYQLYKADEQAISNNGTVSPIYNPTSSSELYRVRTSWDNASSQV